MFVEITPHSWACQMMLCQKTLQQSLPAFDEKSDVGSYRRKHHKTSCTYFFPGENDLPFSLIRSRLTHRICLLANLQLVLSKQTSVVQAFKVMLLYSTTTSQTTTTTTTYTLGWVICINSIWDTSKKWDFGMKINFPKYRCNIQRSPPS